MSNCSKLFIGGLPWQTDEAALKAQFDIFGEVKEAAVVRDRDTGRSRGFGFVRYFNDDNAHAAIDAMNEQEFGGRTIRVAFASDRRDQGRGGAPGPGHDGPGGPGYPGRMANAAPAYPQQYQQPQYPSGAGGQYPGQGSYGQGYGQGYHQQQQQQQQQPPPQYRMPSQQGYPPVGTAQVGMQGGNPYMQQQHPEGVPGQYAQGAQGQNPAHAQAMQPMMPPQSPYYSPQDGHTG